MFGGYSVIISKYTNDYCQGCIYKIEFEAFDEIVEIKFIVKTSNSITKLEKNQPALGYTIEDTRSCFIYNLTKEHQNENLIVSTNLFSGNASLYVQPWGLPNVKRDFILSYTVDDLDVFKLEPFKWNTIQNTYGNIYFCFYAQKTSLYIFNVFLENDVEKNQATNTLIAGN